MGNYKCRAAVALLISVVSCCGSEAEPGGGRLGTLLNEVKRAVSYTGVQSVRIVNREELRDRAPQWTDTAISFLKQTGSRATSTDFFCASLICRVLSQACAEAGMGALAVANRQNLADLRQEFQERFKKSHPGIEELWIQVEEDGSSADKRHRRLNAALLGCRTSSQIINAECWGTSDAAFHDYFASYEDAYVFALLDMLYTARDDKSIDANADFLIPLSVRFHHDDVVLALAFSDGSGVDVRRKMNLLTQKAWRYWNERFVPMWKGELDLSLAWNGASRPEGDHKDSPSLRRASGSGPIGALEFGVSGTVERASSAFTRGDRGDRVAPRK